MPNPEQKDDLIIDALDQQCGVAPGRFFANDEDDFLEWAKRKGPEDVLAHSSVAEPTIHGAVTSGYCSPKFAELLKQDNQWGLMSLKRAIAERYGIEDTECEPRVLLTPGASNAIYVVCKTFLSPGDEVIVELPCYQPLRCAAQATGAHVVAWRREDKKFSLDLKTLESLITPKTKLIMLSNPHNPSSALTSVSEFLQMARAIRGHRPSSEIKIAVDEIYLDIAKDAPHGGQVPTFAGGKISPAAQMGDEFISINSLSKVYGLSRIRCGWILGSPEVIEKLRETYKVVVNIGSLDTEAVASIIFENLDGYAERSQRMVESNRKIMEDELGDLIVEGILDWEIPEYGCLGFPRLPWLDHLAHENSHYNHYVRIGFGGSEDKFHDAISNLRAKLDRLYRDNAPH
jgi:aspartate/methionine/tyrosine aminotransferase